MVGDGCLLQILGDSGLLQMVGDGCLLQIFENVFFFFLNHIRHIHHVRFMQSNSAAPNSSVNLPAFGYMMPNIDAPAWSCVTDDCRWLFVTDIGRRLFVTDGC